MGLRIHGDSMYPKIEDGDIIVVRKQSSVDSGSIAVILVDGEEGLVKNRVRQGLDRAYFNKPRVQIKTV
ncbi:MAG: S24 family peptidase [Ruminococcaceae bacterium]|nr:S24 family peptidase [Oscillospiraceae bacterium]